MTAIAAMAALAVLCCVLTIDSDVSAEPVTEGPCGVDESDDVKWSFDAGTGTLTIYGNGKMMDFDDDYKRWGGNEITKAIIGEGVTSIGNNAFYDCESLTSVTIPESVKTIGDFAFAICESLTSVTIPASVTYVGFRAFAICESLTSVTIPASVTYVGERAFTNCTSLTSVTILGSGVEIGFSAFLNCSSLEVIKIKNKGVEFSDYAIALNNGEKHTIKVVAPEGYEIPDNALSEDIEIEYDYFRSDSNADSNVIYAAVGAAAVAVLAASVFLYMRRGRP